MLLTFSASSWTKPVGQERGTTAASIEWQDKLDLTKCHALAVFLVCLWNILCGPGFLGMALPSNWASQHTVMSLWLWAAASCRAQLLVVFVAVRWARSWGSATRSAVFSSIWLEMFTVEILLASHRLADSTYRVADARTSARWFWVLWWLNQRLRTLYASSLFHNKLHSFRNQRRDHIHNIYPSG